MAIAERRRNPGTSAVRNATVVPPVPDTLKNLGRGRPNQPKREASEFGEGGLFDDCYDPRSSFGQSRPNGEQQRSRPGDNDTLPCYL